MGKDGRKNIIVVGAGASKEFGLPTGMELKTQISRLADIRFEFRHKLIAGEGRTVEALEILAKREDPPSRDINPYLHAAWLIRDNMPLAPSIDNFLDTHRNDEKIVAFGKLAITQSILDAERSSQLYISRNSNNSNPEFSKLTHTWLARLFSILVSQRDLQTFISALADITFVSFNYDRCVQHFISHAARSYFNLNHDQVRTVLSSLNIIYPYGSVGDYEWNDGVNNGFGGALSAQNLCDAAYRIRTFTEGTDSERIEIIRQAFLEADVAIFLGFGFLPLNMELLFGDKTYPTSRVLATGLGLSKNSLEQVKEELEGILIDPETPEFMNSGYVPMVHIPYNVDVLDVTCGNLVFEFERFLLGN